MHKLCIDNNAFVEFQPSIFFIKDQITKKTILQGHSHNDLYNIHIDQASSSLANPSYVLSAFFSLWHSRLRPHTHIVVAKVLIVANIKHSNSNKEFCTPWDVSKSHKFPFVSRRDRFVSPFDLLYVDFWVSPITHALCSVFSLILRIKLNLFFSVFFE